MMDNLEKQIRDNRSELDKYDAPSGVWKRIEKDLKKEDRGRNYQWLYAAAAVAVILTTAVVLFRPVYRWSEKTSEASGDYNQLKETEIYYNNIVNSLYKEATPLLTGNPDMRQELNNDLSQLDSIFIDLKKDLKDNISNQEVMEALVRNYRIRIQILEDMITMLKDDKTKTEKKQNHEL
jgi:hypothetical protein